MAVEGARDGGVTGVAPDGEGEGGGEVVGVLPLTSPTAYMPALVTKHVTDEELAPKTPRVKPSVAREFPTRACPA